MSRLGRLIRRRRAERQLDAELRDHLERQVADYVAAGLGPEEARRRATLELGGLEQVKERCRDAGGTRYLDDLVQDLRYGCRVLRKSPVFTLVAVASLALGIGANTMIFTLVDSLILRSLPVRAPERLVRLDGGEWTNPIWEQIRECQHDVLDSAAAFSSARFDLARGGEADFAEGLWVSGGFFDVTGVPAILGRTLTPGDDVRGGGGPDGPVAVVSYAFWQRRFGGAADAVGRSLTLDGVPFTIVGVTPPGFFGPAVGRSFDVAVPIGMVDRVWRTGSPQGVLDGRAFWWLDILGRLKPGQTLEAATTALRARQPHIREATLPTDWRPRDRERYLRDRALTLVPAANGFSELRDHYERPLLTVMGVVVLVLLIACANLAGLLLARANARRPELGARLALGASRRRLGRQLLSESLLLAVPGALLGLALARWGSRLLVGRITSQQGLVSLDVSLHWRVLLFTTAVTLATALLFGIAPALRAGRLPPHAIVQHVRGAGGEGTGAALAGPLLVAQVALSLVLVFAAGLFLRTFVGLQHVDLGLEQEGVLLVNVDLQRTAAKGAGRAALLGRVQEAAAAVPGVAHAAVSVVSPVSGMGWNQRFEAPAGSSLTEEQRLAWMNAVTPGWFRTYGTPLLAGRDFDARDGAGAPVVAIVNEAFALRFGGGHSPLGRAFAHENGPGRQPPPFEVVGVVKDAVYRSPRDPKEPTVYVPIAQLGDETWPFATLSVKSAGGPPALLAKDVARRLQAVDPSLSLTFRMLSEQVGASVAREQIVAWLAGFFGGLALLLAGIGLYGVTSQAVGRRRTEIGLRMALGADAARVVRLVLGRTAALVGLGLAIGAGISLWASQLVGSLLFGLQPRDPATLGGAALVLAMVGVLAAGIPARRATRIDPAQVLREG